MNRKTFTAQRMGRMKVRRRGNCDGPGGIEMNVQKVLERPRGRPMEYIESRGNCWPADGWTASNQLLQGCCGAARVRWSYGPGRALGGGGTLRPMPARRKGSAPRKRATWRRSVS